MSSISNQGSHVFLDYTGAYFDEQITGEWLFAVMREAVEQSPAREVHAHLSPFDGVLSPPGFAAVVLIDESHITAHCYADRGLLAIDCFTCGDTDPEQIAAHIHNGLMERFPDLVCVRKERIERFISEV